ncbi:protein TIFY 11d-like [Primulina huaijiensis]|uniref:protein TIFY 11d-like n=1 Tax=Primulina huaijiensis TaxID=1492673 RepID=UPI003CC77CDA
MGTPEVLDSGKRSNFSQTCSLLSQYLKENKGSFGELGLVLSEDKGIPARTMNLLPMIEKSGQSSGVDSYQNRNSGMKSGAGQSAPMTIFYAGQMIVFDDLPAEKADKIMMLASTAAQSSAASFPKFASAFELQERDHLCIPHPLLASDLTIKRKISLARFSEKRKDRIIATEPYQARKPSNTEAWLELAPRFSSPNSQRH